jgi:hypothetical protein
VAVLVLVITQASGLMHSSRGLRAATYTVDSVTRRIAKQEHKQVEAALQRKMAKSSDLRAQLVGACDHVAATLAQLQADKGTLAMLLDAKAQATQLSQQRSALRTTKPRIENTSDTTQHLLARQQSQLAKHTKALSSCLVEADCLTKKLTVLQTAMEYDLRDKSHALELDAKALSLDGKQKLPVKMSVGAAYVPFREKSWGRKTSSSIADAKKVAADASLLSRRLAHMERDYAAQEAALMKEVQASLKGRLSETLTAAEVLELKLRHSYKELESTARSRAQLAEALESKRLPLQLVQQRYSVRHTTRPGREAVNDEVEVALATEFSELSSMVKELGKKGRKIDLTLKSLNTTAKLLEDNLKNKRAAYDVDVRAYHMASSWKPKQTSSTA